MNDNKIEHKIKNQTILVTGAAGFIGNRLCEKLLLEGAYVKAIIRRSNKKGTSYKISKLANSIAWNESLIIDLSHAANNNDYRQLFEYMKGCDTIFHLAGISHTYYKSKELYQQVNVDVTKTLLYLATDANINNFIYFSSIKAIEANDLYGQSKLAAEQIVLEWGRKHNKNVCILRPALVYGRGMKGNLLQMFQGIKQGWFPPVPIMHQAKSMVWIEDVVDAAILVVNNMNIANQKQYTLSEEKTYSTSEIYDAMRSVLNLQPPLFRLPYFIWQLMAIMGDVVSCIIRKRLPINSGNLKKLFASSVHSSELIRKDLNWKTKGNFSDTVSSLF